VNHGLAAARKCRHDRHHFLFRYYLAQSLELIQSEKFISKIRQDCKEMFAPMGGFCGFVFRQSDTKRSVIDGWLLKGDIPKLIGYRYLERKMREKKMKDKNAPRSSRLNFPFPDFPFQRHSCLKAELRTTLQSS